MSDFILSEPSNEYVPIPDGEEFLAELVDCKVQVKPWKDSDGNDIEKVVFRFLIFDDGPFDGRNVVGETSTAFVNHPDCKLRAWVMELLKVDQLETGFQLALDMLIGQMARVVVNQREGKPGPDGSKRIYNNVIDVKRTSSAPIAADIF